MNVTTVMNDDFINELISSFIDVWKVKQKLTGDSNDSNFYGVVFKDAFVQVNTEHYLRLSLEINERTICVEELKLESSPMLSASERQLYIRIAKVRMVRNIFTLGLLGECAKYSEYQSG